MKDWGTENYPEANLPTSTDIENLFKALEDCLHAAGKISIHDKATYFQYYDILDVTSRKFDKVPDSYRTAVETIAMHAGETEIGRRFLELEIKNGKISDRSWYQRAYHDSKEIPLSKLCKRKKFWEF